MSFKLPPLSIPPACAIRFIATCNAKKAAKTTVARVAANELADAGYELVLFQHDVHPLLHAYGTPTRIVLSSATDVVSGKAVLDLKRHEPLEDAVVSLSTQSRRVVLLDASGPGSERIGTILHAGRFNGYLSKREVSALFLIPVRVSEDSALGALAMMQELHAVMPDHYVVPVPICDPESLELLGKDHSFFRVIRSARHGVLHLPLIADEIAAGLERLERPLTEIADPENEDALAYIRGTTGYNRLVSGMIAEAAQQLITAFEEGLAPLELARIE